MPFRVRVCRIISYLFSYVFATYSLAIWKKNSYQSLKEKVFEQNIYIINTILTYEVHIISFQTFFIWTILSIWHTWNSSPLRSNRLRLQCDRTVPTTSGRPRGSPLVRACQWLSSQSLTSPQLSHNDSFFHRELAKDTGSKVWTTRRLRNCFHAHLGQIVCDKDGVVDWCIILMEMSLTRFDEFWPLPTESLPEIPYPLANQLWCIDFILLPHLS